MVAVLCGAWANVWSVKVDRIFNSMACYMSCHLECFDYTTRRWYISFLSFDLLHVGSIVDHNRILAIRPSTTAIEVNRPLFAG